MTETELNEIETQTMYIETQIKGIETELGYLPLRRKLPIFCGT